MKRRAYGFVLAVLVACSAAAPALAHDAGGCEHTHPGIGSACGDVIGDDCTLPGGETGRCRQVNRACICAKRSSFDDETSAATTSEETTPSPAEPAPGDEVEIQGPLAPVRFEVDGLGSFTARASAPPFGTFDTAKGDRRGEFREGSRILLQARPAAGASFIGWFLNGSFSSNQRSHTTAALRALRVKAVFGPPGATVEPCQPADAESTDAGSSEEIEAADDGTGRICSPEFCNGCKSSLACRKRQVGERCTVGGRVGTCFKITTCPRLLACCGCRIKNRVFTGDGRIFSLDGQLLEEGAEPEEPAPEDEPPAETQTVTVGYERIEGRREIGQRLSGASEAAKSKTVAAPPRAAVRRAVADGRTRKG